MDWQPVRIITGAHLALLDDPGWAAQDGIVVRGRPDKGPSDFTKIHWGMDSGCDGLGQWVLIHPEDSRNILGNVCTCDAHFLCPHMYSTD